MIDHLEALSLAQRFGLVALAVVFGYVASIVWRRTTWHDDLRAARRWAQEWHTRRVHNDPLTGTGFWWPRAIAPIPAPSRLVLNLTRNVAGLVWVLARLVGPLRVATVPASIISAGLGFASAVLVALALAVLWIPILVVGWLLDSVTVLRGGMPAGARTAPRVLDQLHQHQADLAARTAAIRAQTTRPGAHHL